jgi:hypothetical protein
METLFSTHDLSRVLENQIAQMRDHINKIKEDYLLNVSESDLTDYLKDKYSIEPITLGEAFIASSGEVDIDVSHDPMRGGYRDGRPIIVKGMQVHIRVPFTGDGQLFWCRPSSFTLSPPQAVVTDGYLEFYISGDRLVGENVKRSLESALAGINGYLLNVRSACEAHNASLERLIHELFEFRKKRLLSNREVVASIGLPVQAKTDAPRTYVVPSVQRKPEIRAPVVKERAFVPEPALDGKEYEHILSIIRSMVSVIERSPKAFAHMGEEDLRSHFLVQLNGQYQGRATGETFNYEGKTDILIREADRNVFIAECKIWKGETELLKAVDQILAYLHWRDTKAALLVFNRNKAFSEVLAKIPTALQRHPNFKKLIETVADTEWRLLFSSRDDSNRELQLAVLLFDVPRRTK